MSSGPHPGRDLGRSGWENGYVLAHSDWGMRLRFGHGVAKDVLASAEAFIAAAERGDIAAIGNLCDLEAELREIAIAGNPAAAQCLMEMFTAGSAWRRTASSGTAGGS